jgi:hypothetical protein
MQFFFCLLFIAQPACNRQKPATLKQPVQQQPLVVVVNKILGLLQQQIKKQTD